MTKGKQMELDLRADLDRFLQEQASELTESVSKMLLEGRQVSAKNRYEGYGMLASSMAMIMASMKTMKKDMAELLEYMRADDFNAAGQVAVLDDSLTKLIGDALKMSALAKRIGNDLLVSGNEERSR